MAYGRWEGMVDPSSAIARCREWSDAGLSNRQIADVAGVARSVVHRLLSDSPQEEIHSSTRARILAAVLPAPGRRPTDRVDATPVAQWLQALTALGHGVDMLAEQLGAGPQSIRRWRRKSRPTITYSTHKAVEGVYLKWQGTPGMDDTARATARAHGWLPPVMLEDAAPDNPGGVELWRRSISRRAIGRVLDGHATPESLAESERKTLVLDLTGRGWTDRQIATHTSWAGGGVHGARIVAAYRRRHGIEPGSTRARRATSAPTSGQKAA
jgi:hypothetical protein